MWGRGDAREREGILRLAVLRALVPKARPPDVSERLGFCSADVIIEARSASEQRCLELESGLRRLLFPGHSRRSLLRKQSTLSLWLLEAPESSH